MSNFRPIDRDTGFLLPPSVDEWLPERHLARFVVEVIGGLDLRSMTGSYRGSGSVNHSAALPFPCGLTQVSKLFKDGVRRTNHGRRSSGSREHPRKQPRKLVLFRSPPAQ